VRGCRFRHHIEPVYHFRPFTDGSYDFIRRHEERNIEFTACDTVLEITQALPERKIDNHTRHCDIEMQEPGPARFVQALIGEPFEWLAYQFCTSL